MKTRISALMDGELDGHDLSASLRALSTDAALRREWSDFHVIGDALRGEGRLGVSLEARVMAAIADEPAILAPAAGGRRNTLARQVIALAASLAGIAVVGWVALGEVSRSDGRDAQGMLAARQPEAAVAAAPVPQRLQEYLVAHQAHAPATAPVGGTRFIRSVSVERSGR